MKAAVVLSSLIVLFTICAEAARQPRNQPWLAVLSFTCGRSTDNCIGIVLDNHWVLTTATCFRGCKPMHLSISINIPPGAQRRLASSIRMGNRINGSLVPNTFANNLAFVKLDCHNYTLETVNLPSHCSVHEGHDQIKSDGYIYRRNKAIKFRNTGKETECFSGTGSWYYLDSTLQMVATTSNSSSCMVTSICKHTEQIQSFMEGMAILDSSS